MNSDTPEEPTPEDGIRWFEEYVERLQHGSVRSGPDGAPYTCPCCGYLTLGERGGFEICSVCFWEDDGQDKRHADDVRGGPNGSLSLRDAQRNFDVFGASKERSIYLGHRSCASRAGILAVRAGLAHLILNTTGVISQGNPDRLMERYYDAHLECLNHGGVCSRSRL